MRPDSDTSSRWLTRLHRALLRGKQVILHGNVADLFLLNGAYTTLRAFFDRYFPDEGFQLLAHYDIVDGVVLPDAQRMGALLQQARGGSGLLPTINASADARGTPPAARRTVDQSIPFGAAPAPGSPTPGADPSLVKPEMAFPVLRRILGQNRIPSAITVAFADKLVGDAQHQAGDEPRLLVMLKKMIQEAALIDSGPMANRRNALVIVAERLSGVPGWLYQENPLIELVHVTVPERNERMIFYRTFIGEFHGGAQLGEPERAKGAEEFADLTDALTAQDLHSIRRTSVLDDLTIARPRELVQFYKFGDREDPWKKLNTERVRAAAPTLRERVIGQDDAVRAVVEMLVTARVGLSLNGSSKAGKPKGLFFFVGPTGVGKTELAKSLTALLFSDETAFARFDMSEYAMEHAAEKLAGSPPGFIGYDEGGQLTGHVLRKPFSLLLFDEIEKAHGKIMDKFLQILEDGRLTDSKGQTADFSQTVIIFTSNIGSDTLGALPTSADGLPERAAVQQHYLEQVRRHFCTPVALGGLGRPELLNRFGDNILVFDVLRPQYIQAIAKKFLPMLQRSARDELLITLDFGADDRIPAQIEKMMRSNPDNLKMGGRRVLTLLEKLRVEISQHVFEHTVAPGATVRVSPAEDGQRFILR